VGWDDLDIAPAEAKKLTATDPSKPEEEFGDIGQNRSKSGKGGGGRIGDSGLAVGHIPKDMPMVDRHGWGGFSAKATLHTSNGELGEDMGSGAAPKEIALDSTVKVGPMDTLGGFEGALPSVGSVRG
jgi:hypothetical protein